MPRKPPTFQQFAAHTAQSTRFYDLKRRNLPHRRLLNDTRWQEFSRVVRAERPVCERCRQHQSEEVHHIRGLSRHPEDWLDREQVAALCKSCHSSLTGKGE